MGATISLESSNSAASDDSKTYLERGVLELQRNGATSPQCVALNKLTFPTAIAVSLNENHEKSQFEPPRLWHIERRTYGLDTNAFFLNYETFEKIKVKNSDMVRVTPYAADGGVAETIIFLVDFSYEVENKNYSKKTYNLDTDRLAKDILSVLEDKDIFSKTFIELHDNENAFIRCPLLKLFSCIMVDSNNNHFRRARLSDQTKILFRCQNRRICMSGSCIDRSRKVFNKLCTKEGFMEIKNEIGGLDHVVDQLYNSLILSRLNMEKANELGLKVNFGAIFVGPPGTGKSALAALVSKKLEGKYTFVKGPELKNGLVGSTERQIRELFDNARKDYDSYGMSAPYHIVVIDEIDALTPQRNTLNGHDNSMTNQFLACTSTDMPPNLLIFGTTNMLHLVDSAITREGRLGLCIEFKLPDNQQRAEILNIYLNKIEKYLPKDMPLDSLVELTRGFTGADIEGAVNEVKHILLEDQTLTVVELSMFEQVFQKRRLAKQFCNYIIWHSDIEVCSIFSSFFFSNYIFQNNFYLTKKNFINTVAKAFEVDSNLVHMWNIHGHGLVPLIKYIADHLSIKAHIFDNGIASAVSKDDAIIFMHEQCPDTLQLYLKTFPHKYIIFNIISRQENADFCMPTVKDRAELETIVETKLHANMSDFENTDSITFPYPLSKLFRLKRRLIEEKNPILPVLTFKKKRLDNDMAPNCGNRFAPVLQDNKDQNDEDEEGKKSDNESDDKSGYSSFLEED